MSFSKAAVRVMLNLPSHLSPEVLVCFGHPAPEGRPPMRTRGRITWQSLTDWEGFPSTAASAGCGEGVSRPQSAQRREEEPCNPSDY
jgi:hypothetical protein